jgi:hypothetical protein
MNYKNLILTLLLLPAIIFSTNNDTRIKQSEDVLLKDDSDERNTVTEHNETKGRNAWRSDLEYNYYLTTFIWTITSSFFAGFSIARENDLGKSFYVTASNIALFTLIAMPINHFVINYLLKRNEDKKADKILI